MHSGPHDVQGVPARHARVVIVHSSDELYGADRIVLQVARAISERFVGGIGTEAEVEVWLPDDVEHAAHPLCEVLAAHGIASRHVGLPVLRRAYMSPRGVVQLVRASRQLRRCLSTHPVDVLYLATSACLIAAPLARRANVRSIVLHLQELWVGPEARLLRWLARFTTSRIAISDAVRDAAGLPDPIPVVVHNCVERPQAAALRGAEGDRPGRPGPVGEGPHYVVASRWNAWKGHATLMTAWEQAGCPGLMTVLGGPPPVGASVDVHRLVASLAQPETVTIRGEVADISPYIAAADALILPSDTPEPFGLVVIEAFAAGVPVIASRAGGPLEVITEGVDGWFFGLGDARALATLLSRLTSTDLERAGRAARHTYQERFTPERYRQRIATLVGDELNTVDDDRHGAGQEERTR